MSTTGAFHSTEPRGGIYAASGGEYSPKGFNQVENTCTGHLKGTVSHHLWGRSRKGEAAGQGHFTLFSGIVLAQRLSHGGAILNFQPPWTGG